MIYGPGVAYADFGPLVVESDIDDSIIATLKDYFPTYLRRLREERGLEIAVPTDESYLTVIEDDDFPSPRLPAVLVTTAQTAGEPETAGDGTYIAAWNVTVSGVVRGATPAQARQIAALFGGTIRRILVQRHTAGGGASAVRWTGGVTRPVSDTANRAANRGGLPTSGRPRVLAASSNTFVVYVDEVMSEAGGPQVPDDSPGVPPDGFEDLPLVTSVRTDIIPPGG